MTTIEIPIQTAIEIHALLGAKIVEAQFADFNQESFIDSKTARGLIGCSASHLSRIANAYNLKDKSRKGHKRYRVSEVLKLVKLK